MGFHLAHQMLDMSCDREAPQERIRKFLHRLR
jgi:hypothetical protein